MDEDQTGPGAAQAPVVILVEPQMGENIGAAARAMANFGLSELRLVSPRDGWPNDKARANARGAEEVVDAALVFATFEEAIADLTFLLATTARNRGMSKPVVGPREAAVQLRERSAERSGIVFGRERNGLLSDEVALADLILTFPVSPGHTSLNLSQAVLLVGYEWHAARDVARLPFAASDRSPPASHAQTLHLFQHLEGALDEAEFFRPPEKRPSMVRNLRNILTRIGLTHQDVQTLRGAISALESRRVRGAKGVRDNEDEPA